MFRRVFVLVGLRIEQFPTKEETQVLIDFCRRRLGNYTAEEILIAFEMAITGDFKAETEHFGQFTAKYLTGVLSSYNDYRNRLVREVEEERCKARKIESKEEAQQKIDEFYGEAVDLYRNSKEVFEGSKYHANVLYEVLKLNYTDAELIDFKKQAGQAMQKNKEEFEKLKVKRMPIPGYLQSLTFSKAEWKRQTAILVANDALKKEIKI